MKTNPSVEKIAVALGGKQSGNGWMVRCVCHDDNNPSLSVNSGEDGKLLVKCFAGCEGAEVLKELGKRGLLAQSDDEAFGDQNTYKETWDECVGIQTVKARALRLYLKNRGLVLKNFPDETIRLHPSLAYFEGKKYACQFPTMIAKVLSVEGYCLGLHRTYLNERGEKCSESTPRKSMGNIKTGAIRLDEAGEVLALAEGVETSLAVREATGLPTWSVLSTSGLTSVELPSHVKTVRIWADKDKSEAGMRAATSAAQRFIAEGKTVYVHLPTEPIVDGKKSIDWNDVLKSSGAAPFDLSMTETKIFIGSVSAHIEPTTNRTISDWPKGLAKEAFYGVAGDFVKAIEPHTESDPAALLLQFLVAFGNVVGRRPYFSVEATRHRMKLFLMLVGKTSKGRKGTAWGHIKALMEELDPCWSKNVASGLSSGEGLISEVKDQVILEKPKTDKSSGVTTLEKIVVDPGVADKRILVVQSEFGSTLRVMGRDGNTLSAVIRDAWDDGHLRTMVKTSPLRSTDSHISIIGHITNTELHRYLTETESANGFGNRFLWVCTTRSKELPEGGDLSAIDLSAVKDRLRQSISHSQKVGRIQFSHVARKIWYGVYGPLSKGSRGLFASMIARSEPQVIRLACLYALLDRSAEIEQEHLIAALAVWEYCEDSCRHIFGESTGNGEADSLLRELKSLPTGMTRTEIRDFFSKNKKVSEIERILDVLSSEDLARKTQEVSDGGFKKTERWFAI